MMAQAEQIADRCSPGVIGITLSPRPDSRDNPEGKDCRSDRFRMDGQEPTCNVREGINA
jgi:hypothetical protein